MSTAASVISFREALEEADRQSEGNDRVCLTAERLANEFSSRNIDYVFIGGIALRLHGYLRYSRDLNVVTTKDGHQKFRRELLGRGAWGLAGYDELSEDAKVVLSYPEGATVSFHLSGEYPGDGKPKPVVFPNPSTASIEINGVNVATLEKLIELKLASGMTASGRVKDLGDVQEIIKVKHLARDFSESLNPYVRAKYLELWDGVEHDKSNDFEEQ